MAVALEKGTAYIGFTHSGLGYIPKPEPKPKCGSPLEKVMYQNTKEENLQKQLKLVLPLQVLHDHDEVLFSFKGQDLSS